MSKHKKNIFQIILWIVVAAIASCSKEDGITPNWPKKTDFPGNGRDYAVAFSIGSKGYFGTGENGSYMKDFWEYDPAQNNWSQKADFGGTARERAIGFAIGTKGYIGTGFDGVGNHPQRNDFWEYDPTTNNWIQKAPLPDSVRNNASVFVIGSKAYVGSGWTGYVYLNDLWEFTPATNTWVQKSDFPGSARYATTGFALNGKGYSGLGFNGQYLSDLYEYDPSTDSWVQQPSCPVPIAYAATFPLGENGYVCTGRSGNNYLNTLYEYNATANHWTKKVSFTGSARLGATGFSVNGKGYVVSGYDGQYKTDMFEYFP